LICICKYYRRYFFDLIFGIGSSLISNFGVVFFFLVIVFFFLFGVVTYIRFL